MAAHLYKYYGSTASIYCLKSCNPMAFYILQGPPDICSIIHRYFGKYIKKSWENVKKRWKFNFDLNQFWTLILIQSATALCPGRHTFISISKKKEPKILLFSYAFLGLSLCNNIRQCSGSLWIILYLYCKVVLWKPLWIASVNGPCDLNGVFELSKAFALQAHKSKRPIQDLTRPSSTSPKS